MGKRKTSWLPMDLPIQLNVEEAAKTSRHTPGTIRQYCKEGRIAYSIRRIYRKVNGKTWLRRKIVIDELDLRKFLENRLIHK